MELALALSIGAALGYLAGYLAHATVIGQYRWTLKDRNERIRELERQVDEMHQRGLTAPPPPEKLAPAKPSVVPHAVEDWIDGFDDPDTIALYRAEAEEDFGRNPNLDPDRWIAQRSVNT